ncbi:MAG: CRISPR-associated endonuclease Cas3'' [Burkholderiales bacterium]|nr:CRISPR-associated endonuclease Cas3'' [Burkholderiales bacterium]
MFAHSYGSDPADWQPLADHLGAVAALAGERGKKFGAERAAIAAGLLHDLGKYNPEFQARLLGATAPVDHSTAGAAHILSLGLGGVDRIVAEGIAHAIAGHHGGMPDRLGPSGLDERVQRAVVATGWERELSPDLTGITPKLSWRKDRIGFQLGLLARMIFSALVDGDWRDTEAFYDAKKGYHRDRSQPTIHGWPDAKAAIDRKVAALRDTPRTPVNTIRQELMDAARAGASLAPGLFTMTAPTGTGKTLALLAFAIDHARIHKLDRLIYALPFTSVVDQTADVFRSVLGSARVLEHHSSLDPDVAYAREGASKLRLATEDWDVPVVVTTNVQLFESLFTNRPGRARKLHNLARAVIVLDEPQGLPRHILLPCVAALDELARNYGTTIVLATATQPAFTLPRLPGGLDGAGVRELAPRPRDLTQAMKRVRIQHGGALENSAIVAGPLTQNSQALVIVNSRRHARDLFEAAKGAGLEGLVHLSTYMHANHRRAVLAEVRQRLADGRPCRLVSTSLVEAGVDVDFPAVWRAEAGLDSIAQAAGRCNREGRRPLDTSIVTVFAPVGYSVPPDIRQLASDANQVMKAYSDPLGLDAIEAYFGRVYWRAGAAALDRDGILGAHRADATGTNIAYRSINDAFALIEDHKLPVVVPTDARAQSAVTQLGGVSTGRAARQLQPYVVQVAPRHRDALLEAGHAVEIDGVVVLTELTLYLPELGLQP